MHHFFMQTEAFFNKLWSCSSAIYFDCLKSTVQKCFVGMNLLQSGLTWQWSTDGSELRGKRAMELLVGGLTVEVPFFCTLTPLPCLMQSKLLFHTITCGDAVRLPYAIILKRETCAWIKKRLKGRAHHCLYIKLKSQSLTSPAHQLLRRKSSPLS